MVKFLRKKLGQIKYIKHPGQIWRFISSEVKSIELAITYNCNFHCPGCYAGDLREPVFMPKENALNYIKKYKPMHVNITGGEPLLHPDLFEIIEGVSNSIILSMVTNGSLLNEEKIKKLKEAGLNTIQISFGKNYPIENLELAAKCKKAGLNVCLSVTNTKKNREHILKALNAAKENGYHVLWNLPSAGLMKEFDKEIYFKYRNDPIVREDNMFWAGKNKCPAGTKKIYITAKGELMPCDRMHKIYSSYEEMKKEFKNNKIWCSRWGEIKP